MHANVCDSSSNMLGQACGVKKFMHALRSAHSVINRF